MTQSNAFFATARPRRLFFKVALPGMISMLAASLYSIIEGVVIGHTLGAQALAAVSLAMPFVFLNFSLADLVGVGSAVPISIALGRKDNQTANNIFSCSLILIVLAGVLMGAILFFTSPFLVRLMGADGATAAMAVKYVRVFALLGPVTTVVFAMDNYLRICGFVKGSMALNIFMSCLTAALVLLFLAVLDMDVAGSALATSGAMAVCAIIAFVPFLRKKTLLRLTRPRFSLGMCRQIVACGTPVFLNNIAGRVASVILNFALIRLGGDTAVAAFSVLMYAGGTIEPLLYGLCDSTQPAIGYNWGAGSCRRVRDIAKCAFIACGAVSAVGAAVMFFFPQAIASLFIGAQEVALIPLCVHAMRLFAIGYLFRWFGFAVQGFYSAIERPFPATVLSLSGALLFPVLFILCLSPLGLDGLWLNQTATAIAVFVLAAVMMCRTQKNLHTKLQ